MYIDRMTRVKEYLDKMRVLANKVEAIYKEIDLMPIKTNDFNAEDKKWIYDLDLIFINTIVAKQRGTALVSVVMK